MHYDLLNMPLTINFEKHAQFHTLRILEDCLIHYYYCFVACTKLLFTCKLTFLHNPENSMATKAERACVSSDVFKMCLFGY